MEFDRWPTFVLDLANNHGGRFPTGCEIIDETAGAVSEYGVRAALKLQYRDNKAFKHGDETYREKFMQSALSWDEYLALAKYAKKQGMWTACTPFDPAAAKMVGYHEYDYVKVASCSARDWPTLEAVAALGLPTIFSTANLPWDDMDNLVSFAEHRALDFALMHCVALYPMHKTGANLRRITEMRDRYPGLTVGWSTHEDPNDLAPIGMAYAHGARIFERHVGAGANAYSSSGPQLCRWFEAWADAVQLDASFDAYAGQEEAALTRVERKYDPGPGIDRHPLKLYIHRTKASLALARIALPSEFTVEFSHHYGLKRFEQFGAVMITCVNRAYCKKLLIVQAGQEHPYHYHKQKEETFQVLHGELWMEVDGHERVMKPGDLLTVLPGQWHCFMGRMNHTIFEEISTTALPNDSVYRDPVINANDNRKTAVKNWGRFELA